jgi:hypothetical protein
LVLVWSPANNDSFCVQSMVRLGIVFQKRRQDTEWGFGGSAHDAAQTRSCAGGRKGRHGGIIDPVFDADGNGHQSARQQLNFQQPTQPGHFADPEKHAPADAQRYTLPYDGDS